MGAYIYSGKKKKKKLLFWSKLKDLNFSFMMKRLFNELNEEKASKLTTHNLTFWKEM